MLVLAHGNEINAASLPPVMAAGSTPAARGKGFDNEIEKVEIKMIKNALQKAGNNKVKAAGLLKIKRTTLMAKMKKYGIGGKQEG